MSGVNRLRKPKGYSMNYSDNNNIGIAMAVWAIHDEYDLVNEPNYISVTKLLKPLKMIILSARAEREDRTVDIGEFIARALGNSIHASVEKAWHSYKINLQRLGYPQDVIDAVILNPEPHELTEGCIPVYIEQRAIREIEGFRVGGKFDMVLEGIVHDNKTTSAFSWQLGGRDEDHMLQGSCYKWLNPDKITEDFIRINYLFTDWQRFMARQNPSYPQSRIQKKDLILMSPADTEQWIANKLRLLKKFWNAKESEIPACTSEELWLSEPKFKYFSNPDKTDGKSTKNFDDRAQAYAHLSQKGVGVVKEVLGEPKRCAYCDAWDVCEQRQRYFPDDDPATSSIRG